MTDTPSFDVPPQQSAPTNVLPRPLPPPHNAGWAVASLLLLAVILYTIVGVILFVQGDSEWGRHGYEHGKNAMRSIGF